MIVDDSITSYMKLLDADEVGFKRCRDYKISVTACHTVKGKFARKNNPNYDLCIMNLGNTDIDCTDGSSGRCPDM